MLPTKIKLFNQTINVVIDNDYCNGKCVLGEADINHNRIKLCNYFDGRDIPEDRQLHTLFHELVHVMFFMVGQTKLYTNEILTDTLATIMEDLILNNDFKLENSENLK